LQTQTAWLSHAVPLESMVTTSWLSNSAKLAQAYFHWSTCFKFNVQLLLICKYKMCLLLNMLVDYTNGNTFFPGPMLDISSSSQNLVTTSITSAARVLPCFFFASDKISCSFLKLLAAFTIYQLTLNSFESLSCDQLEGVNVGVLSFPVLLQNYT
jgi:hypothetical protein